MRLAISFCRHDLDQMQRWLAWCAELGGCEKHDLFVMPAKGMPGLDDSGTARAWKSITLVPDYEGVVSDWPETGKVRCASGPNSSFRQFARYFYYANPGHRWFWMEPDGIFLCQTAIDQIEAEDLKAGKRFMGSVVEQPNIPRHSSGIGVYPPDTNNVPGLMNTHTAIFDGRLIEVAFDVAGANDVLADHHDTKLIQHVFRGPEFKSRDDLSRIRPGAVVFHTDKLGGLITLLRERKAGDEPCVVSDIPITPQPVIVQNASLSDGADSVQPTAAPKVFCYFAPGAGEFLEEQHRLLKLWADSWKANGWEPVVLGEADAQKHPRYAEWKAAFEQFPIKNPPQYEMPCFVRWIAMSEVGGGLMSDYDVLNNGFTDMDSYTFTGLHLYCNHVPCVVSGKLWDYEGWIETFIDRHVQSDMSAFAVESDVGASYCYSHVCKEPGTEGWEHAKLIHFSHAACKGRLRSEVIAEFLNKPIGAPAGMEINPEWENASHELDPTTMQLIPRGNGFKKLQFAFPEPPKSRAAQIREHAVAIKTLVGESVAAKNSMREELRKQGLLPEAKRMKKRMTPVQKLFKQAGIKVKA